MKLPGQAWLEMRARREGFGSHYEQRAVFLPRGLAGHLYWAAVAPFHADRLRRHGPQHRPPGFGDTARPRCHYFGEVVASRAVLATTSPK